MSLRLTRLPPSAALFQLPGAQPCDSFRSPTIV
jgi:hypothetical protein